jgi:hypothetical protein
MQTYVKRSFQGKIKDAADYKGEQTTIAFNTTQYEPYYLQSNFNSTRDSSEFEDMSTGGGVARNSTDNNKRTGSQNILAPKAGGY